MGDMLSQAEIDALLNGSSLSDLSNSQTSGGELSSQEIDALGEIGNISMGTSATTLFTLLGQKVLITTPKVTVATWDEISREHVAPCVAVRVEYTHGLVGSNLLVMKEDDVKIITDLMMGGEGKNTQGELTDLHLSAISEAMNQMIGSSATSMSSMVNKRIDISPPKAFVINFDSDQPYTGFDLSQKVVKIAFRMVVGNLIDSEIMQLLPIPFAKDLVSELLNENANNAPAPAKEETVQASPAPAPAQSYSMPQAQEQPHYQQEQHYAPQPQGMPNMGVGGVMQDAGRYRPPVNVQPAQFQPFDDSMIMVEKKNISLIMDVPLEITVELGRTHKMIREILEFGSGSIIELDKLAGEPVDILVNGKKIAKGEVVVIDESFGVRITDIIDPSKRL